MRYKGTGELLVFFFHFAGTGVVLLCKHILSIKNILHIKCPLLGDTFSVFLVTDANICSEIIFEPVFVRIGFIVFCLTVLC